MPHKVIAHIVGEEPVVAEIEHEPDPKDQFIRLWNCRRRDGKDLPYLEASVQSVIFPWHRITFLEMMPSEDDKDDMLGFFRE